MHHFIRRIRDAHPGIIAQIEAITKDRTGESITVDAELAAGAQKIVDLLQAFANAIASSGQDGRPEGGKIPTDTKQDTEKDGMPADAFSSFAEAALADLEALDEGTLTQAEKKIKFRCQSMLERIRTKSADVGKRLREGVLKSTSRNLVHGSRAGAAGFDFKATRAYKYAEDAINETLGLLGEENIAALGLPPADWFESVVDEFVEGVLGGSKEAGGTVKYTVKVKAGEDATALAKAYADRLSEYVRERFTATFALHCDVINNSLKGDILGAKAMDSSSHLCEAHRQETRRVGAGTSILVKLSGRNPMRERVLPRDWWAFFAVLHAAGVRESAIDLDGSYKAIAQARERLREDGGCHITIKDLREAGRIFLNLVRARLGMDKAATIAVLLGHSAGATAAAAMIAFNNRNISAADFFDLMPALAPPETAEDAGAGAVKTADEAVAAAEQALEAARAGAGDNGAEALEVVRAERKTISEMLGALRKLHTALDAKVTAAEHYEAAGAVLADCVRLEAGAADSDSKEQRKKEVDAARKACAATKRTYDGVVVTAMVDYVYTNQPRTWVDLWQSTPEDDRARKAAECLKTVTDRVAHVVALPGEAAEHEWRAYRSKVAEARASAADYDQDAHELYVNVRAFFQDRGESKQSLVGKAIAAVELARANATAARAEAGRLSKEDRREKLLFRVQMYTATLCALAKQLGVTLTKSEEYIEGVIMNAAMASAPGTELELDNCCNGDSVLMEVISKARAWKSNRQQSATVLAAKGQQGQKGAESKRTGAPARVAADDADKGDATSTVTTVPPPAVATAKAGQNVVPPEMAAVVAVWGDKVQKKFRTALKMMPVENMTSREVLSDEIYRGWTAVRGFGYQGKLAGEQCALIDICLDGEEKVRDRLMAIARKMTDADWATAAKRLGTIDHMKVWDSPMRESVRSAIAQAKPDRG